jgi:hypothetical protein
VGVEGLAAIPNDLVDFVSWLCRERWCGWRMLHLLRGPAGRVIGFCPAPVLRSRARRRRKYRKLSTSTTVLGLPGGKPKRLDSPTA